MTKEQQTISANKIKSSYLCNEKDKYQDLKALNTKVQTPPRALAYVLGILGSLILGVGMCICLGVIAKGLMAVGVVVGCAGIAVMIATPFIHRAFLKARKKKYGGQVIALADELIAAEE